MKRHACVLLAALALAVGCNKKEADKTSAADHPKTASPFDQSNERADLDTTADIRKALMANDLLSTGAKNITIVTSGGTIVLRGSVKDDTEHTLVVAIAKAHARNNRVDDKIEVPAPEGVKR